MNDMELKEKEPLKNSGMKISTKIAVVTILVGIVVFLVGSIMFRASGDKYRKERIKSISETVDAGKIEKIDINIAASNVKILKSSDDKIHVEGETVPESLDVRTDGEVLVIATDSVVWDFKEIAYNLVSHHNKNIAVNISLPEKVFNEIEYELGAGETSISGINCQKAYIGTSAGRLEIVDFDCSSFDVDSSAGDVVIRKLNCDSSDIDLSAGKLDVEDMTCNTADFDNSAGATDISRIECKGILSVDSSAGAVRINDAVSGGLQVDNSAGEIRYRGTVNGDIDVDSSAGDIVLKLTNPESDFSSGSGKYSLSVECSAGDKDIEYNCK